MGKKDPHQFIYHWERKKQAALGYVQYSSPGSPGAKGSFFKVCPTPSGNFKANNNGVPPLCRLYAIEHLLFNHVLYCD